MNTTSDLWEKLADKEYRRGFVTSQTTVGLPFQIRALRKQRGWSQARLAEEAGMKQSRISAIETVGGAKLNIDTLERLAAAFDVALQVRFVPFSELARWRDAFDPDSFRIDSFPEDLAHSRETVDVFFQTAHDRQEGRRAAPPISRESVDERIGYRGQQENNAWLPTGAAGRLSSSFVEPHAGL